MVRKINSLFGVGKIRGEIGEIEAVIPSDIDIKFELFVPFNLLFVFGKAMRN
jgi:hypothetical protein